MSARLLVCLVLPFFGGCVAYVADDSDLHSLAAEIRQLPGGTFTVAQAIDIALHDNPQLRELEARARAAGAVTQPLELQGEWRGGNKMLSLLLDPVALLDLGPRGGLSAVDDANAAAAVTELAVARWRTAAAVTETFLLDRALAQLTLPALPVDAAMFERAGLASPTHAVHLRAAQSRLVSEAAELTLARERNRAALRRLLGRDASTAVAFDHAATTSLPQPDGGDASLLARPDLLLPVARFQVADAEFRSAVADQYPSLMLGPEIPLAGGPLQAMAVLRVPFAMSGRAEAAHHRRDAAREALAAAWVDAANSAADADLELAAATTNAKAAEQALESSLCALATATTALQVDVDVFDQLAEAATMATRDLAERRVAVIEQVRANVRRAMAYGWPRQPAPETSR